MAKSKKAKINLKPKEEKKPIIAGNEVLFLRIGVIILALVIFGLWIFIQNNVWRSNQNLVDISELRDILNEPVPGYENTDEVASGNKNQASENEEEAIEKKAEELLDKIIKEADERKYKPDTSSCPEWINCMPSIGAPRNCNIPPACEGITQIVW